MKYYICNPCNRKNEKTYDFFPSAWMQEELAKNTGNRPTRFPIRLCPIGDETLSLRTKAAQLISCLFP